MLATSSSRLTPKANIWTSIRYATTTATWLIAADADVKTVQTIMRHSDIRLTLDRYGHLFPGSEAAAIGRIRSAFTQSVELRQTGTAAVLGVQDLVQQLRALYRAKGCELDRRKYSSRNHRI